MKIAFLFVFVISIFLSERCLFAEDSKTNTAGENTKESAVDGLKEIIRLNETKNFDKLIRERYAELHKCKNEDEIKQLIGNFSGRFGDDKVLANYVAVLKSFLTVMPEISETGYVPQISETGRTAVFKTDKGPFRLYELKTGKWGFHL